ncbi:MAG: tetratricopeptide repeat protein [Anaerolineae bacterium]
MEPETIEARPSPLPQIILVLIVGIISLAVVKTYVIDNTVVPGVNKDGLTSRPIAEQPRSQGGGAVPNPAQAAQPPVLPPPASAAAPKAVQPPPAAAAAPSAAGKAAAAATPAVAPKGSDPEGASAAANAGNQAFQRADLDGAIEQFTRALELNPLGVYYGLRGNTYWRKANLDAALADYNRAVELDPQNADNYFGRAHVYKDMKKPDQARQDLQVFLDLKPNTPAEAGIRQEAQQMLNDLP